jgi:23S rRNA-/tRNA-specific pseudouridylate synthase
MAVSAGDGRDAYTSYRVIERLPHATVAEAKLHTGRTHQLRVHFQHIGFPIAGDETYGAKLNQKLAELMGFKPPRVLLHAHKLAFVHPRSGRRRAFTAPPPEDFQEAIKRLRAGRG